MNVDNFIAGTAVGLGLYQMVDRLGDINSLSVKYLMIGILANILWIFYQTRKGANYSAIYTGIGLIFQLYALNQVLLRDQDDTKHQDD
jgi:hypothetical protein|tara:strand:- start:10124 stop:10387 length:264 start_codon:yes stop_codon:yes gene_type:complete